MNRLFAFVLLLSMMLPNSVFAASSGPKCISHRGSLKCYARIAVDSFGHPLVSAQPAGFGPQDWRRAYGRPGGLSSRIAIVVAFGDTNLASDLTRYSSSFGLSNLDLCTFSSQNSCLDLRTQNGTLGNPGGDSGWALETALDAETIHGVCPSCRLEVVSARSASVTDLLAAVDRASLLGASVISMSWGGSEFPNELNFESHFARPGITFIASSGDSGYGTAWPAASNKVIAVGGTNLSFSGGLPLESTWKGSGSGCSRFESKPIWQRDSGCKFRMIADLSADADPETGAAIYRGAWYRVGGTSLATPIVAGFAASHGGVPLSSLYKSGKMLRDVLAGSNGSCSRLRQYFCNAGIGFDGPTGLGTLSSNIIW